MPEGTVFRGEGGVYRQVQPQSATMLMRDGGNGKGSYVIRRRRFPSYIDRLRAFLDGGPPIGVVDRQVLEYVCEGHTLQWIADEIGIKKATIHKRIVKIRKAAGIAGPGPGR
jgi:hypothetical protein